MKKIIYISLICIFIPQLVKAQSDGNYEYTKEFTWGFNKNTNGGLLGGFVFKWGRALTDKMFQTYGFELVNVKHPKEFRYPTQSGSQFIWGKSNYLYSIRGQYGRDFLLFKKAPQQGVQINASLAAGPTIGIVAPYYVQTETGSEQYVFGPSSPNRFQIVGTGRLFQGLGESKIKLGLNAKASLSFELGAFKSNLTGFEVGFLAEGFTGKIPIIPTQKNKAFYTSGFITIFYGLRK